MNHAKWILCSLCILISLYLNSSQNAFSSETSNKTVNEISPKIFMPELILPQSLEKRRGEFEEILLNAQKRLLIVAKKYEWSHILSKPLMTKAQIFDSKESYDEELHKLFPEAKEMKIPSTFTAGFKDKYFFAVSPEIYQEKVPQYVEPKFYEKLITHELAHKLHTQLVNGDEDKMGPIWFWEGFATLVSGQFENDNTIISKAKMLKILSEPKRGSYKEYNQVIKHFVKLVPLPELVRRASKKEFKKWLLENANP